MDHTSHNALQGCVSSLRSGMQLLDSSINILDSGVSDFPRLAKVLQTTRHFELVSSHDLSVAQNTLLAEIEPEIGGLLGRVETYLDRLERRERSLIAKADLQEGRLAGPSRAAGSGAGAGSSKVKSGGSISSKGEGLSALDEAKLQQLRQKRERLSFAIGRLELQAGQRERQLRKSMAAQ